MGEFKVPVQPPISATKDFYFQVPGTPPCECQEDVGAHLHGSLPHPEEVFLQHRVGFHLPPDLVRHTHPPAQGQGHKSECKEERTQ